MKRMSGKVALVTGAASEQGLGYAIAATLAEQGANVVVTDIDYARLEKSASGIGEPDQVAHIRQDVGDQIDWDAALALTLDRFGRLDVLVNNAGISQMRPMDVVQEDEFDQVIRINLKSVFLGSRVAMAQMRRQGSGGSIINMSSVAGIVGFVGTPAYTASKGGVRLMSKTIALEGAADGIRCNSLHPGVMWTEMQQVTIDSSPGTFEATRDLIPMRKLGTTQDIANAALFLASDESQYVTGTEIIVDGGLTAQ